MGKGRWNRRGQFIVYTSESISLAKLETLANTPFLPDDCVLFEIQIHDAVNIYILTENELPNNWNSIPYPEENWDIIDLLLADNHECIRVPSATTRGEHNFLLNGNVPKFKERFKLNEHDIDFDPRLN